MRIGIIGATGFIGSALASEAVKRGIGVVVFSRRKDLFLPWAKEIRPVHGDGQVIDPSDLDALVNLAGESVLGLWTRAKRRRIRESRITLTERIVEALKQCPQRPGTFLSASGTGAYGNRGDEVLTENSERGKGFLADVCADWEAAANAAIPLGVRVVLLRTGLVLGRDGGTWPLLRRIFRARIGGRLGNGKQWMPWIHLADEVGIILHALEKTSYAGPVNLTAPNPVTNTDLTTNVAGALGRRPFLPTPAFLLRLFLGQASSMLLDSQRVHPQSAQTRAYNFQFSELNDALLDLTEPQSATPF